MMLSHRASKLVGMMTSVSDSAHPRTQATLATIPFSTQPPVSHKHHPLSSTSTVDLNILNISAPIMLDDPMHGAPILNIDYDSEDSMSVDSHPEPTHNNIRVVNTYDTDADADPDVDAEGESINGDISSPGATVASVNHIAGPSSYAQKDSVSVLVISYIVVNV